MVSPPIILITDVSQEVTAKGLLVWDAAFSEPVCNLLQSQFYTLQLFDVLAPSAVDGIRAVMILEDNREDYQNCSVLSGCLTLLEILEIY